MDSRTPLLSNSNRLSSDDSGSDNGSGDDAKSFYTAAASVESDQPQVAAAPLVQRQISQLDDISERIRMINPDEMEHNEIIFQLFGTFSKIALALENKTLTESEANTLYQLIAQINVGNANRVNRLTRKQIRILADIFKESAEGTARDLDLLTTMLRENSSTFGFDDLTSPKIQQVVARVVAMLESATLEPDRIFDSEKAIAAMMRLCTSLNGLGVQTNKCNDFNSRLSRGLLLRGTPIDMASVTRMSQEQINLDQITHDVFTSIIEAINQDADVEAKRQHESEVRKARLRFHKGGRGNMQKKQSSRSKKSKLKNTRKSKYNKSKYNNQLTKTQKKILKNKTKKVSN